MSDIELILRRMNEMHDEVLLKKAIADFTSRVDSLVIFSDEEIVSAMSEKEKNSSMGGQAQSGSFARPAGKATRPIATRVTQHQIQSAGDPIAQLRGDGASAAQARIVVGVGGVTLQGIEGMNVQSGYYCTLNDSKINDVPWPNDFVYIKNGKKASYDTLSIPEFVQGYCAIVVANIPVREEMKAAIDHMGYLATVKNNTEGGNWEMVFNSHRQNLHMI